MLPRRIPKEPKKEKRWRSPAHLSFVRSHECCVPGCDRRPIEAAHVRIGGQGGMGFKPPDWCAISLCSFHHSQQHSVGEASFERMYGIDMRMLADEFAEKSPKRAIIKDEKAKVG